MKEDRATGGFTPEYLSSLHESMMREMRALHEANPPWGLTMPQFRILFIVHKHGKITPGELAAMLDVTAPTITDIVNRLAASGLLTKERSDQDRRVVYLSSTPAADKIMRDLFAQWSMTYLNLFRSMDAGQRDVVGRGLEELLAAIRRCRSSTPGEAGGEAAPGISCSPTNPGVCPARPGSAEAGPGTRSRKVGGK
ncbi:MAG: winged helix-turn-helix transcriptional regulator [Firmicutes bacterium]|nr:winged helix-turn-helix transcriptional regulator [Bacillota bacterium]